MCVTVISCDPPLRRRALEEQRFSAYVEGFAQAVGHRERVEPLKDYWRGLLLPGPRKSVEPRAARLHPDRVLAARQSLHHLVAKAS